MRRKKDRIIRKDKRVRAKDKCDKYELQGGRMLFKVLILLKNKGK